MSTKLPIVAIVGQTNAGKSSLFNRLIGRKDAIVAREAGTTRDSVVRTVNDRFVLVDTAGLKDPEDDFEATIQDQVDDAIDSADLILLVKDITEYPDQTDRDIAKKVLKSKKPVILVLNKADLKEKISPDEYLRLGIKDIVETSAEHNRGISRLMEQIAKSVGMNATSESPPSIRDFCLSLQEKSLSPRRDSGRFRKEDSEVAGASAQPELDLASSGMTDEERATKPVTTGLSRVRQGNVLAEAHASTDTKPLKLALIGRPNVGKSHLFNTLSKKQQAIVAPVAGTTRDINRVSVKYHGRTIELLDTAGVRKPGKIERGVEKFSVLRTVAAIEEADICLLLVDAQDTSVALDQKLAGMIAEAGKGLILAVSKWDLKGEEFAAEDALATLKNNFDFVPWAPVIFTSSVTGQNVAKIFELAATIAEERQRKIPTSQLNKILQKAVAKHPPAGLKNTHPKFRYVVQTDVAPPWFVIYGANFKFIHWSYKRYLERQFRDEFGFNGTPIKFSFRDEKQMKK
ncbi:ribosome biogenesis GTPase Der [Candidatus Saccharibacteria bacterium]|nr:ribosome biogenesis GTPase Der [Candidatus Saccharibacteria bacterium]